MIKDISELRNKTIEIDLTGPDGNAFVLIGMAQGWSKGLGLDGEEVAKEMMVGDYENLLRVMEKYFGDFIVMYR